MGYYDVEDVSTMRLFQNWRNSHICSPLDTPSQHLSSKMLMLHSFTVELMRHSQLYVRSTGYHQPVRELIQLSGNVSHVGRHLGSRMQCQTHLPLWSPELSTQAPSLSLELTILVHRTLDPQRVSARFIFVYLLALSPVQYIWRWFLILLLTVFFKHSVDLLEDDQFPSF